MTTTPTREQAWPLFDEWYSNNGWKYVSSREGAFITWKAARSDLEATIAEQAAEIDRLKRIKDRARQVDLEQQLSAEQAYAEQLREASGKVLTEVMDVAVSNGANSISMPDDYVALAALISIPNDTTALQEYGAKLVERIACIQSDHKGGIGTLPHELMAIADKIRKGAF